MKVLHNICLGPSNNTGSTSLSQQPGYSHPFSVQVLHSTLFTRNIYLNRVNRFFETAAIRELVALQALTDLH